ncbi:MAG: hypothetical protein ACLPQS_02740 [Acidimicrobiales bacterium]|jgi:hypothetical protein
MIHRLRSRRYPYAIALLLAVPVALALGPASVALAAWSTQGSGSAAGAAPTMPTGTAPSGSAVSQSVTISWSAADMSNGTAVAGYVVKRYNSSTGAPATVGTGCSGTVAATTCTEQSVALGTWVYTVTPVQVNWTGVQSPESSPITVT